MNKIQKETMMNKRQKEQWLLALRSGEYKQGYWRLYREDNDTYCCLGVAIKSLALPCALTGAFIQPPTGLGYCFLFGHQQSLLSAMNDNSGKSFLEIADYIEKEIQPNE